MAKWDVDKSGYCQYCDYLLDDHGNCAECLKDDGFPDDDYDVPPTSYQVGGDHYARNGIQPIEYIMANELDFCEGNVVKYVTRWTYKNGVEDLLKARQYLDFLIKANS